MFKSLKLEKQRCLNFRQLIVFYCSIFLLPLCSYSFERALGDDPRMPDSNIIIEDQEVLETIYQRQNNQLLKSLNPYARTQVRGPANLIPQDEITPRPITQKAWISRVLKEDDAGVLSSLRNDIRKWQEIEEYAHYWNLESTGLHQTPDDERKMGHLKRQFWRYFDRRLSEEINSAEEGSTLHTVGRVEKAVTPENTDVQISENYKLSFKVRPIQGRATIELENPYLQAHSTISASGKVDMVLEKDFEDAKVNARMNYYVDQGYYVAQVNKGLTDHLSARAFHYSPRENQKHSEQRMGLYYSKGF